jgi:hypothetical protein
MQPYTIFSASSHYLLLKGCLFELWGLQGSDAGTSANQQMEDSETASDNLGLHDNSLTASLISLPIAIF